MGCDVCKEFTSDRLEIESSRLNSSAEAGGCPCCRLLYDAVGALGYDRDTVSTLIYWTGEEGNIEIRFKDSVPAGYGMHPVACYDMYTVAEAKPSPWKDIPIRTRISGDTGSEAAFKWVLDQMSTCLAFHTSGTCQYKGLPPLPTRVLDLGHPRTGLEKVDNVRLYESVGKHGLYACLSHCWGKCHTIQTTSLSLARHLKVIAFSALPKTFQDAVVFVRRLSIRCLWIDSLCIVQDDIVDWQREAEKMASIYENSIITIGAAHANDDTEGCYARATSGEQGVALHGLCESGEGWEVHLRKWTSSHIMHGDYPHEVLDRGFPLFSRAWVFQERLLSPRFISFGPSELLWECCSSSACECSSPLVPTDKAFYFQQLYDRTPKSMATLWQRLVSRYTGLDMTRSSDRLAAIAGLAKQQRYRTGRYLAGLWEDNLIEDLLWVSETVDRRVRGLAITQRRPEQHRAPTWSWASIDSHCVYSPPGTSSTFESELATRKISELSKVIDISCSSYGADPFLGIKDASLILVGRLIPIFYGFRNDSTGGHEYLCIFEPGCSAGSGKEGDLALYKVEEDIEYANHKELLPSRGEDLYCLEMADLERYWGGHTRICLVLKRIIPHEHIYERIGRVAMPPVWFDAAEKTVVRII